MSVSIFIRNLQLRSPLIFSLFLALGFTTAQAQQSQSHLAVFETSTATLTIPALPYDGAIFEVSLQLAGDGQTLNLAGAVAAANPDSLNPAILDLARGVLELPEVAIASGGSTGSERYALTLALTGGPGVAFSIAGFQQTFTASSPGSPYQGLSGVDLALAILGDLSVQPQGDYSEIAVFDERGRKIAEQGMDSFGVATEFFSYDSQDRLLTVISTVNAGHEYYSRKTYFYDDQGRLAKTLVENDDGSSSQDVYVWNGDVATVTYSLFALDPNLNYDSVTTRTYDNAGQLIGLANSFSDSEYIYENGKVVDRYHTLPTGTSRYHYVYNAENNLLRIEFDSTDSDTIVDNITYYDYEAFDVTNDGLIDVAVVHSLGNQPSDGTGVGSSDDNYQSASNNTSGGLNWDGHDTGTCSTCGNMQGQINKILLGF